ncbi:hypothetical protein H2200_009680 [Cladophialophora chaetospira]|uniref:Uncharacterized protein n=1 Tax=Cladophialophora chaetospira TaxID=386627 RepID=A0AA38X2W5_9EURO|nr:hypothetical protein H2200_009680 [Cladophialophora chaetospira]
MEVINTSENLLLPPMQSSAVGKMPKIAVEAMIREVDNSVDPRAVAAKYGISVPRLIRETARYALEKDEEIEFLEEAIGDLQRSLYRAVTKTMQEFSWKAVEEVKRVIYGRNHRISVFSTSKMPGSQGSDSRGKAPSSDVTKSPNAPAKTASTPNNAPGSTRVQTFLLAERPVSSAKLQTAIGRIADGEDANLVANSLGVNVRQLLKQIARTALHNQYMTVSLEAGLDQLEKRVAALNENVGALEAAVQGSEK